MEAEQKWTLGRNGRWAEIECTRLMSGLIGEACFKETTLNRIDIGDSAFGP